jgi:cysteine desulfurase/selenocysteine lyase
MPIFLNNTTTAWPKAPGVAEAVTSALTEMPCEPDRSAGQGEDIVDTYRSLLAKFLGGVSPARIAFLSEATAALNTAISGFDLKPGDRILTTVMEHNSVLRPLHHLSREKQILLDIVGCDETGALDGLAFETSLRKHPRLVILTHASNVTGRINPSLFDRAHSVGAVTMLDASQSPGRIEIDAAKLQADIVIFPTHKGLRAIPGIGILFIRNRFGCVMYSWVAPAHTAKVSTTWMQCRHGWKREHLISRLLPG